MLDPNDLPGTFDPGPSRSLFILESPDSLRILPFEGGCEVLLPMADLLAFFLHLASYTPSFARATVVVPRLLTVLTLTSPEAE